MNQIGEVSSVNGDFAEVIIKKESGCGENCASCGMCDMSKLRKVTVYNECGAKVGDRVKIVLESWKALTLAAITFILPLVIFLCSFMFLENELLSAGIFVLAFILSANSANILAKSKTFRSRTESIENESLENLEK